MKHLLWSGTATLHYGNSNATLNCRAYQSSKGNGDLTIEGECGSAGLWAFQLAEDLQLEIPGIRESLDISITESTLDSNGLVVFTMQSLRTPYWFSQSNALRSGRFVIVNFGHYWMGHPANLNFTLEAGGYIAHFIAVNEKSIQVPQFTDSDDFKASYQVEFSRDNELSFTEQEAQDFIWKLTLFLSFCRGQWVGYSLMVGLDDKGESALVQWGTGRVSTWHEPSGWLDEHHGNCIHELCENFFPKLKHEAWMDAISHVVYWFARADTNSVGPDGACILLQAALERLAWHILVRERNVISEDGFRNLTAADQLRLMLAMLSIPTAITNSLAKLQALGRSRTLEGPEVFTYIRNRLTHPPKLSTRKEQLPYYEAYCLAQWYVELTILSSCGYSGEYGNRTVMKRWKGQVEKVPWA